MEEHELKAMQEQVTEDFRMTWKMMGDLASNMEAQASQMRAIEGRMRHTEERFTLMMEAVTHEHVRIRAQRGRVAGRGRGPGRLAPSPGGPGEAHSLTAVSRDRREATNLSD